MFCPKCGNALADDARFCTKCGTPLAAYAVPNAAQPAPAQPAPMQAVQMQPAPVVQSGAPAPLAQPAAKKGGNGKIIGIVAAAAVVIVAAVLLLPNLFGNGGAGQIVETATGAPAINAKGKTIEAIARPTLFDLSKAYANESASITPSVPAYTVAPGLANVSNVSSLYLSDEVTDLLAKNGFAVTVSSGNYEFFERYESNRYMYIPNFITVDSMMHTYHLYFAYLMKTTEQKYLYDELLVVSNDMFVASLDQLDKLSGTEWEQAARRNAIFFGVGTALLDRTITVPNSIADDVNAELTKIYNAGGLGDCVITGSTEDYTQYIPRGYYAGDAQLEQYFRAMMWYGRMNFAQNDEDLDRSALLMTLALNEGSIDTWAHIYTITSFFAGASDDCGYYEYFPVFQAAYGENATVADLAGNKNAWSEYHALTELMPAPKINSVVVMDDGTDTDHLQEAKGYRFMGQRFSVDAAIMQNLVYNKVGENAAGGKRMMPDALDVPAALGSDEALAILDAQGATGYKGYSDNMQTLRELYGNAPESTWSASLYSRWLYTLNPLLEPKGEGYPSFMQSTEWARKNLQSYLGSYTELKHDSVLYSKQVMVEMGGGGVNPADDRGYVEAEPEVFARLAVLTQVTRDGLDSYGMLSSEDADNLTRLQTLSEQLSTIAAKELQNETPTDEEFELIRTYGGQLEHFWTEVIKHEAATSYFKTMDFPAAVVTDIATNPDAGTVLEIGTGKASTIYVVVPVDGTLRIASGSVYSFYQFEQPASNRLTDQEWRESMGFSPNGSGPYGGSTYASTQPEHVEDWTRSFQYEATR